MVQRHLLAFHQALSAFKVIGCSRVTKSLKYEVIGFIPLAGMDMQFGDPLRSEILRQPFAQQIAKEMVIAVPTAFVVQGNNKQIGAFKIFQGRLPGRR